MSVDRRTFMRACTGAAATAALAGTLIERLAGAADLVSYTKSRLVDADGKPIKASTLGTAEAYVFHYPMKCTPCLLIKLGIAANPADLKTEAGEAYVWQGGVGADKDIVAYCGICAHQMAYPMKNLSVISYQAGRSERADRKGVITCCAHGSVYDPAEGAAVVFGPAPQPLATIKLEYDPAADSLYATGVYGGNRFDDFIKANKADLMRQFGRAEYKQAVDADVQTVLLSKYSDAVVAC
jgi:arsenite oxidase small subunit